VKTDKGGGVPMAGVGMIQATLDPKTVDDIRNYPQLHKFTEVIPIYMRTAIGGNVEIADVRTGAHTACAIFGNPMTADPATIKFKCTPVKVGTAAKQAVTITVPAAWFEDKP
jgi:hypothetical protein